MLALNLATYHKPSTYRLCLNSFSFSLFHMDSSSSSSSPEISLAPFTEMQQSRFSYKNATHEEVLEDLSRSTTFGPPLERSHFLFQPVYSQSPRS